MTLYFISGLGIDRRAFSKLTLPATIRVRHLEWIAPLAHETLPQYARRLAQGIDTSEAFALAGLSYGGMIATEIARVLAPRHVILISSAATTRELPPLYRLFGALKLHKLVPARLLKQPTFLHHWFFGARTPEARRMLRAILKDTSPAFLHWAIGSVLTWCNSERPPVLYHIHGREDKVLPLAHVHADRVVEGGGHLLVFSHATLLSKLLAERLGEGS